MTDSDKLKAKAEKQFGAECKNIVSTYQAVKGTAYQKTSHRVMQEVRKGATNIMVVTNSDNPELKNLTTVIGDMNLHMPQSIVLKVVS